MRWLALLALLCGCYVYSYPVTKEVVSGSIYEVKTGDIQGTTFVVAPGYLMTAGHMCKWGAADGAAYSLGGMGIEVHRVIWSYPDPDLCIYSASPNVTARPLVIAAHPPKIGEAMETQGWPNGTPAISTGVVDGEDTVTAPTDHGASGSPVYTKHGVFGVLVSLRDDEKPGFKFVELSQMMAFFEFAEVPVTIEPTDNIWTDSEFD
jgi:hypothetical protein